MDLDLDLDLAQNNRGFRMIIILYCDNVMAAIKFEIE